MSLLCLAVLSTFFVSESKCEHTKDRNAIILSLLRKRGCTATIGRVQEVKPRQQNCNDKRIRSDFTVNLKLANTSALWSYCHKPRSAISDHYHN